MAEVIHATEFRKKQKPKANPLTASIVGHINAVGGFATRINTQGQFDPIKKIWRPGSTVKGMSDIVAVYKGQALFIEVKVGRDKQTRDQMMVELLVNEAGGHYLCAHNLDEFLTWFNKI